MMNQKRLAMLEFFDGQGRKVPDLEQMVFQWKRDHPEGAIYIGADSKVWGERVKYATVVCLWDVGRGVKELYRNEYAPKPKDSFTRLWTEVTKAVEVAEALRELGEITVHVDINENPKYRSHALYDASMGFITSMGFKAAGKPFAWAASCGAHRHCQ